MENTNKDVWIVYRDNLLWKNFVSFKNGFIASIVLSVLASFITIISNTEWVTVCLNSERKHLPMYFS